MKPSQPLIMVIDGFYDDPMKVRREALSPPLRRAKSDYGFNGSVARISLRRKHALMRRLATLMGFELQYDVAKQADFKFLTRQRFQRKKSTVHFDLCEWSGVLNLTPVFLEPQFTTFWAHRELELDGVHDLQRTAERCAELGCRVADVLATVDRDSLRPSKWIEGHRVQHAFNRLILFRGNMFHSSSEGFGTRRANAKLSQTFFFNRKGSLMAKHAVG